LSRFGICNVRQYMKVTKRFIFPFLFLLVGVNELLQGIDAQRHNETWAYLGNTNHGPLTPGGRMLFGSLVVCWVVGFLIAGGIDARNEALKEVQGGVRK
jgi:hypothetical protein